MELFSDIDKAKISFPQDYCILYLILANIHFANRQMIIDQFQGAMMRIIKYIKDSNISFVLHPVYK